MTENKWMPIESAPRDGKIILIYGPDENPYSRIKIGRWSEILKSWVSTHYISGYYKPTHWHPLPEPPK